MTGCVCWRRHLKCSKPIEPTGRHCLYSYATRCVWLAQASPRRRPTEQKTGEPLIVPAGLGPGTATLLKPDGTTESVALSKEHTTPVKGTDRSGLYRLSGIPGEDAPRTYAFNLASRSESDNGAQSAVKAADVSLASSPSAIAAKREVWRWLALVAALILLGEWWVYHRRIGM